MNRALVLGRTTPVGLRARVLRLEAREVLIVSLPLRAARELVALTRAERDVARRAAAGQSNPEIARARGASKRTIANQLASVFAKLHVQSRAELAHRLSGLELEEEGR